MAFKGDWSEWNWIEYGVACQMSVGFAEQECGGEPKLWCAWKDCGCKIGKLVDICASCVWCEIVYGCACCDSVVELKL